MARSQVGSDERQLAGAVRKHGGERRAGSRLVASPLPRPGAGRDQFANGRLLLGVQQADLLTAGSIGLRVAGHLDGEEPHRLEAVLGQERRARQLPLASGLS